MGLISFFFVYFLLFLLLLFLFASFSSFFFFSFSFSFSFSFLFYALFPQHSGDAQMYTMKMKEDTENKNKLILTESHQNAATVIDMLIDHVVDVEKFATKK